MTQNNPFADAFKTLESFGKQNNSVDFDNILSAGKQNLEAFQKAGTLLTESFQSIAKAQAEIVQANAESAMNLFKTVASSQDPRESASKQADYAKSAFEKASKDAQQIADIATKANSKAAELINDQVSKNISQVKSASSSAKKPANKAA